MNVSVREDKELYKIYIEGEMTIYHSAELKKKLMESLQQSPQIELDLSMVSEMDTAGFQLLFLFFREAAQLNRTVRLASYSPVITTVLDLFSMDKEGLATNV